MVFSKKISNDFIKEIRITCLTFMTYTFVGICRGYTPFITSQLREPDSAIKLTEDEESWLAGLTIIPDPFGCLIGGILLDTIGRKYALISVFIPFSIAWLIISLATDIWMLYVGTIFNAVASGMTFNSATYICEMSMPNHRAFLLPLMEPAISMGTLVCNLTTHFLKWELSAVIYLGISASCFLAFFTLPESPMYLMSRNRKDEAIKVLSYMRDNKTDVDKEIKVIEDYFERVKTQEKSFSATLKHCIDSWKPLAIMVGLCLFQQLTGFQVIVAYTTTFFDSLNIPFSTPVAVILYSFTFFVTSFFTPFVAHKCKRKPLLGYSGLAMALFLLIISIYETMYLDKGEKPLYWIVLICIYGYHASLTLGVMLMTFLLAGEVFKPEVRGVMAGINGVSYYIITGIFVKFFPLFLSTFGIKVTLWIFTVGSLLNCPYAVFVLPETQGKSLSEIQEKYFTKKKKESTPIIERF